jgi:hypothetical protein
MKMKRTPMFKRLLVTLLVLTTTINLSFAAGGKLIDVLFNSSVLKEVLQSKVLLEGASSVKAASYVDGALRSLGFSNKKVSKQELKSFLKKMGGSAEDQKYKRALEALLEVPEDKLTKDQMVESIDALLFIANRYGRSGAVVIACTKCVAGDLSEAGFKFALQEFKSGNISGILKSFNNLSPSQLRKQTRSIMRRHSLGDLPVDADTFPPQQEKAFALFVHLLERGSSSQKKYAKAALDMAKTDGGSNLFNNKFWMRFAGDMSDEEMSGLTELMEATVKRAQKDGVSMDEAFERVLKSRAADDGGEIAAHKAEKIAQIKRNKCFFK